MPAAVMCSDTLSFEVLDVSPLVSEVSEHSIMIMMMIIIIINIIINLISGCP